MRQPYFFSPGNVRQSKSLSLVEVFLKDFPGRGGEREAEIKFWYGPGSNSTVSTNVTLCARVCARACVHAGIKSCRAI